jgi:hypothetical protein
MTTVLEGSLRDPTPVAAMAEEVTMEWTRHGPRHPAVRSRAQLMMGERYAGHLRTGMEGLDHQVGTCRPSCSPECYRAKLRSLAFTLPASFRAAR